MPLHELMHIKGGGLKCTGTINVYSNSMTASLDNCPYTEWYWLRGGILSSLILGLFTILCTGDIQFAFGVNALVQFIYGFYEQKTKTPNSCRYAIYIMIPAIAFLLYPTIYSI